MNAQRRKDIKSIFDKIDVMLQQIDEIMTDIENVRDEEDEAYNNLPEQFQEGERGEFMQECIDALDTFRDEVESAFDTLENAMDDLANTVNI